MPPLSPGQSLVTAGSGTLQAALNAASAGDELILLDGDYTSSSSNVLEIISGTCSGLPCDDVTIRAQNPGMAVIDGENIRRGIYITSGTVVLEGLNITRGSMVRMHLYRTPDIELS
jgi:hypothetical protein